MGVTDIDELPYGDLDDNPNGAGQVQALAEAIDGRLFTTGMQVEWIGTAAQAPEGWLAADGSAVTVASGHTALRDLLIAAGNPYGTSGSDPKLPDTRGKVVVGKAGSGTFQTLGGTGGAESANLAVNELPTHTHACAGTAASGGAHTHSVTGTAASDGAHTHSVSGTAAAAGGHTHTVSGSAAAGGGHTHTVSGTAASGGAHTHSVSGSTSSNGDHSHTALVHHDSRQINTSSGTVYALAWFGAATSTNGAHTHTVTGTAASDGAHTHTVSGTAANGGTASTGGDHTHSVSGTAANGGTAGTGGDHTHSVSGTAASGGAHTHSVTGTAASDGAHTHTTSGSASTITGHTGQTALSKLQPYIVVNKLVKT